MYFRIQEWAARFFAITAVVAVAAAWLVAWLFPQADWKLIPAAWLVGVLAGGAYVIHTRRKAKRSATK